MPFNAIEFGWPGNADNKDIRSLLIDFIMKLNPDHKIPDSLTEYAINYLRISEPNKKFKRPNKDEKKALENLVLQLKNIDQFSKPEDIQTQVYTVGKENGYEKNLRDWFKLIYQVIFGEENGPRMGFFISFFGINETINLINDKIK